MPSLHSQSDCCLYDMFLCVGLFVFMSHLKYIEFTYALFDHCCHHGTVLKKIWGKNYEVCWPSPVKKKKKEKKGKKKKKFPMLLLLGRILKLLPFLVQKRNLWREPQQGECAIVLDLIMIYWKYINFTLGSGM